MSETITIDVENDTVTTGNQSQEKRKEPEVPKGKNAERNRNKRERAKRMKEMTTLTVDQVLCNICSEKIPKIMVLTHLFTCVMKALETSPELKAIWYASSPAVKWEPKIEIQKGEGGKGNFSCFICEKNCRAKKNVIICVGSQTFPLCALKEVHTHTSKIKSALNEPFATSEELAPYKKCWSCNKECSSKLRVCSYDAKTKSLTSKSKNFCNIKCLFDSLGKLKERRFMATMHDTDSSSEEE
jgi:hypothetical protein